MQSQRRLLAKGAGAPRRAPERRRAPSQEDVAWRHARSSGAEASIPEKSAESVGERLADAYSNPQGAARKPTGNLRQAVSDILRHFYKEPIVTAVAGFALGYTAALLLPQPPTKRGR